MATTRAAVWGETRHKRRMSNERILALARLWADVYGIPPRSRDWNPPSPLNDALTRDRFYRDGCWPWLNDVRQRFGGWNRMLESAGLPIRWGGGQWPSPRQDLSLAAWLQSRGIDLDQALRERGLS